MLYILLMMHTSFMFKDHPFLLFPWFIFFTILIVIFNMNFTWSICRLYTSILYLRFTYIVSDVIIQGILLGKYMYNIPMKII